MVKSFEPQVRERIRQDLLEKGRELFAIYGLKKTSVEDIATRVGISKGSFYNFFRSKEELFFEIVEEEEHFRDSLLSELINSANDTRSALKQMFARALEIVDDNKIMEKLYQPGVYEHLLRKIPAEKLSIHQANDWQAATAFIEHFQQQGNLRPVTPEIMTGLFRAFFLITLHKAEVGMEIYPQVMELLIDALSKGLVTEGETE
ncbi:MAG: TetR/AcrR family transcriptional regulator [Candidatus Neomarinimicrobiota bacterium]